MSFWPGHANVGGLVVNGVDVHFIAMGQLVPLASGGKGDTGSIMWCIMRDMHSIIVKGQLVNRIFGINDYK